MKIYVVLVDEYISGVNVTHKVSQQGYKTLEEAQSSVAADSLRG